MITMSWKKDGGWRQLVLFDDDDDYFDVFGDYDDFDDNANDDYHRQGYESFPERICKVAQKLDYDEYDNDDDFNDDDYNDDDDNNDFDFHRQGLRVLP